MGSRTEGVFKIPTSVFKFEFVLNKSKFDNKFKPLSPISFDVIDWFESSKTISKLPSQILFWVRA